MIKSVKLTEKNLRNIYLFIKLVSIPIYNEAEIIKFFMITQIITTIS